MLNKISLSVYVEDILSEFNISNDKLIFKKVRRKYERELIKRDLWDKAEIQYIDSLKTRVFLEKDLRSITTSIVDYLLKNSSKDKIKEEVEKVEVLKENVKEDSKVNLVDDNKNNFIDNVFENEKVYSMIKSIYKIVCKENDNLLYNDKITLSDFVEIYVKFFSFKSEVNKNFIFAKIRRKFQQELERKRLWDKAEIKYIGRSKIKLFFGVELYEVGLKVSDYLFKNNEIDEISYNNYKKIVDEVKFKKNKINLNENIIKKDDEIYFMIKSIYKVLNNKENDNVEKRGCLFFILFYLI